MSKFVRSKKGFTLVELLIVVVILGILAAVAIPRFVTTKKESQTQACRSNLAAIQSKIEEYMFTSSVLPSAVDSLAHGGIDATSFPNGVPTCPVGNTPYTVTAGKVTCTNWTATGDYKDHMLN